jgi:hypothetical protein
MVIVEAAPISPRSSATTQAESDETEGDFREGIEVSVQFTGARTSNVADILSRAMGEDDQENAKSILCISNTKHVKVSFTMMVGSHGSKRVSRRNIFAAFVILLAECSIKVLRVAATK